MSFILILVAVLGFLFGLGNFIGAKSAIHEIAAYLCFLLTVIAIIGFGVLDKLNDIKKLLGTNKAPAASKAES
jgi:hypothetical protein